MKKVLTVVGARPNFMKAAPLLRELEKSPKINSLLVHTGQHYDKNMSDVFFDDLDIQKPDYLFNTGSGTQSYQTGKIMEKFEDVCTQINPDLIIVLGDINSTMACSIVAKKLHIKLAHIEAGLRSNDKNMPEEINRLITDSISDYFFITEKSAEKNLINEGHNKNQIFFVGNLMIDSLHYGLDKIKKLPNAKDGDYGLITLHRPSNVDDYSNLKNIINNLINISNEIKLYFSIHPRTKKQIQSHNISLGENIEILDAQNYLEFLKLMRDSRVIFTDSGGIQEESTALKIPCYTLRYNTERPITISQGTNRLTFPKKENIFNMFKKFKFDINSSYKLPEGWDGKTAQRIVKILNEEL
jgi:UDP-N-acetylglucosamine 2-epimerase (non-hydrolysing)